MKIEYYECAGKLLFRAMSSRVIVTKRGNEHRVELQVGGDVPAEIQSQGKEAIKKITAATAAQRLRKREEEFSDRINFLEDPNVSVSVRHNDGTQLCGTIVGLLGSCLKIILEFPEAYRGEADYLIDRFIYRDSSSWYVQKNGKIGFSKGMIEIAQDVLVGIYDKNKYRAEHQALFDLIQELNE